MEKPAWRRRSSTYVVDSPHLRLRVDELELPDGTVIPNYYVRESAGFVIVFALTTEREVILVRQYRYGADAIHLELPAGTIDDGEDPRDCAIRELAEETGYEAGDVELIGSYRAEPAPLRRRSPTCSSQPALAERATRSSIQPKSSKSNSSLSNRFAKCCATAASTTAHPSPPATKLSTASTRCSS